MVVWWWWWRKDDDVVAILRRIHSEYHVITICCPPFAIIIFRNKSSGRRSLVKSDRRNSYVVSNPLAKKVHKHNEQCLRRNHFLVRNITCSLIFLPPLPTDLSSCFLLTILCWKKTTTIGARTTLFHSSGCATIVRKPSHTMSIETNCCCLPPHSAMNHSIVSLFSGKWKHITYIFEINMCLQSCTCSDVIIMWRFGYVQT